MSLSRLRLRLTASFAVVFAAGLTVIFMVVLGYLWRESVHRLDARLASIAQGVAEALEREIRETPDSTLSYAAAETVAEWPSNDDSFGILDANGAVIATADRAHAINSVVGSSPRAARDGRFAFFDNEQDYRGIASPISTLSLDGRSWQYSVIAYHTTEGIEHDVETLFGVLAIVAPLIVLLSLGAGYILASRALTPMNDLRTAISSVVPSRLDQRLPVPLPQDEIGALATEFNALLARLDTAQRQNRRFVREAAHQIRTPLTLVLGEAGNELGTDATSIERLRAALMRIRTAAEQMTHRVDELFLLAEAQAGEEVRLGDDVELDGLLLECTDLMRGRASGLGRTLAIGLAGPILVRGNASLLREALLELIENGCKYGSTNTPVTVSANAEGSIATITVESAGAPFALRESEDVSSAAGVGLPIVQWIARGHHGTLRVHNENGRNTVSLALPLVPPEATAP